MFDRSSGIRNMHSLKDHIEFYDNVLQISENNEKINLALKPKGPIKEYVLTSKNIENRLQNLINKKRAFVFDPSENFYKALGISNFSLSMGFNSAGVLGMINNVYAFFWDTFSINVGPYKELAKYARYNEGFNISHNLKKIIKNIDLLSSNKEMLDQLNIDKKSILLRNHFDDSDAATRIAKEVNFILSNKK